METVTSKENSAPVPVLRGGLPCPQCGSDATEHKPRWVMADLYHCRDCAHSWCMSFLASIIACPTRSTEADTESDHG